MIHRLELEFGRQARYDLVIHAPIASISHSLTIGSGLKDLELCKEPKCCCCFVGQELLIFADDKDAVR